ncbi:MAG: arylsulfatase [Reichenbachiella sp.]
MKKLKIIAILLLIQAEVTLAQDSKLPNVLVILADDIGTGDISHYQKIVKNKVVVPTPNMDGLITEGIYFTNAHSPAALCAPSRYSIMTGNNTYRSYAPWGVWGAFQKSPLKVDDMTLGRLMKKVGYQTAFFGKWHMGGDYYGKGDTTKIYRGPRHKPEMDVDITRIIDGPQQKGFDYSFTFPAGIQASPYAVYENGNWMPLNDQSEIGFISQENMDKLGFKLDKLEGQGDLQWDPHMMGPLLANKAVQYIENQAKDSAPFFIYYSALAVHKPHTPSDSLNGVKIKGSIGSNHLDLIVELDVQIGMLVDKLKEKGLYGNTLIIVTSDNGGLLTKDASRLNHKSSSIYRGGKNQIFEGGHRVPFFALWPGHIRKKQVSNEPIIGLDIMATLAAVTNQSLKANEGMDSKNLLPLFLGEKKAKGHKELLLQGGTSNEVCYIKNGFKLIIQVDRKKGTRNPTSLFDLNKNPKENESDNLINDPKFEDLILKYFNEYNELRDSGKRVDQ